MKHLAPISLVLLTLLVLGRVCTAEFVEWDDPSTIARDPAFNPPTLHAIAHYWLHPQLNIYIPLTTTAWGFLATIAQLSRPDETGSLLNPWVFHTANLIVHALNVFLVWKIVLALARDRRAAWLAAAIFAIHPVQVEAVAWATDLKDLLCASFAFAAILGLIRFRESQRTSTIILATLAMLAACLSKPTGVVTPIIAIVIDTMILQTPLKKSLRQLSGWLVISVVFAIVARIVQPPVMNIPANPFVRPLIAGDAIAFYLWKLFWPVNLALDYGRSPALVIARGWIALTWIAPLLLAIFLIRAKKPLQAGAIIFIAALLPVLGLVPFTFQSISTVADHYLYLPMIGVAICIASLARHRFARALLAIIILALSMQSFLVAGNWRNNSALFSQALRVNPRSFVAHTNWAVALARQGEDELAIHHLRQAIDANPNYAFAHLDLAGLLLNRSDRPAAIAEYREVLRCYQMQQNVDPKLVDQMKILIDKLAREAK